MIEPEEHETIITINHKLDALKKEFSVLAKIAYEYTVRGESIERKIDELEQLKQKLTQ